MKTTLNKQVEAKGNDCKQSSATALPSTKTASTVKRVVLQALAQMKAGALHV